MKHSLLFFLLVLAGVAPAYTQVLENNRPGLRWYQINTRNFRIVFPQGFDEQAQRMANTLEHIHVEEAESLGSYPRKIPVILQNQSSVSNGFVSVLPRRSEFYTMPSQNYNFLGTNDWLNLLASHEYRHIVQYEHATRGFNRLLLYAFGYPTLAGMAKLSAPDWFWEGDAVVTETAFTPSGRGRIPRFNMVFRTNVLEGRTFNYHKQHLRSYKHNIPNHYVLGYNMVSYLRQRTGDPEIWGKITARSWSVPFLPFAFSNAIKKKGGLYVTGLFNEMADSLRTNWSREVAALDLTPFERVNIRKGKAYTDYQYPQALPDGSVLVMKSGIGNIEEFVTIKDGKERRVFVPGLVNDAGMLSVENNVVVWNEFGFDPRWRVQNYSQIKSYAIRRKKAKRVSPKRARYGSAALSPDGKYVVTVQSDVAYQHRLVILNYVDGSVVREFTNPENHFYSMPRWDNDNRIVALKTSPEGRTISLISVATGAQEDLLPVTHENIGHPVVYKNYVFFNSPVTGIDNIYAIDVNSRQRYRVTVSKYGAFNPAISTDGKTLYYNEQGRDGLDVVKIPFDPSLWKVYTPLIEHRSFDEVITEQEGHPDLLKTVPQQQYRVTRYSRFRGIFNPFSWGAYIDDDLRRVDIGITSRDILSTTQLTAGYTFDLIERTPYWRVGASYQGWFPIIDINYTEGKRSVTENDLTYRRIVGNDTLLVTEPLTFKWRERTIEGGIRIPLLTTRSRFHETITIGNTIGYTAVDEFRNSIDEGGRILPRNNPQYFFRNYLDQGSLVFNHFNVSALRYLKRSRRDINPAWGQTLYLHWFSTPFGGNYQGGLFAAYSQFFFPGFFRHHSFFGYVAYQHSEVTNRVDNYLFRNRIPVPRGLSVGRFQKFYSMSGNYTLPLWYPDVALGPILNIQRVRANLFMDFGYGSTVLNRTVQASYLSAGTEVKFDINIMRFLPQFDIGFRYTYGLKPSVTSFELLIGTFNF